MKVNYFGGCPTCGRNGAYLNSDLPWIFGANPFTILNATVRWPAMKLTVLSKLLRKGEESVFGLGIRYCNNWISNRLVP
jgi:hypothetical protein